MMTRSDSIIMNDVVVDNIVIPNPEWGDSSKINMGKLSHIGGEGQSRTKNQEFLDQYGSFLSHMGAFSPIWELKSQRGRKIPVWEFFSHIDRKFPILGRSHIGHPYWKISHIGTSNMGKINPYWSNMGSSRLLCIVEIHFNT